MRISNPWHYFLALLPLLVLPLDAAAEQFSCTSRHARKPGEPTGDLMVDAKSTAEAEHKARQQWPRGGSSVRCTSQRAITEKERDIFARDPWFARNTHLRPYLPLDVQEIPNSAFRCNPDGDYAADKEPEKADCMDLKSAGSGSVFRIRHGIPFRNVGGINDRSLVVT